LFAGLNGSYDRSLACIDIFTSEGETTDSKKISARLKIDLSTAQRSLKRLRELELLKRRQVNLSSGGYNLLYSSIEKDKIRNLLESVVDSWTMKVKKELANWTK